MNYETETQTNLLKKNVNDLTNFDNMPPLDDASAVTCSSIRFNFDFNSK